jgi:anti-sigma B factor antagonist
MTEIIVVKPEGRLDALTARNLWNELEPLTLTPNARVLVDMSETRYLSSEGLRVLIRASRGVRNNHGKMVLCCLNARLVEIISMAGIDRILEIHPTAESARRVLGSEVNTGI